MKRDGRKMDHETLEEIRKMAVERVREGERPSAVIASYGFHRSVMYRWMKAAAGRGKGMRALASRKGTGRPKKLSTAQERQVFRWINGKNPMQYGFDCKCQQIPVCSQPCRYAIVPVLMMERGASDDARVNGRQREALLPTRRGVLAGFDRKAGAVRSGRPQVLPGQWCGNRHIS